MKVRFTLPALADLEAIVDFLNEKSPSAARGISRRVASLAFLIGERPQAGRRTDDANIRRINLRPYPYVLFYEVLPDEVRVMAVMHGARDPASMPGGAGDDQAE